MKSLALPRMKHVHGMALIMVCCAALLSHADDAAVSDRFQTDVRPLLAEHCFDCHGPETQERGIRLDTLSGKVADTPQGDLLVKVQKAVANKVMPPADVALLSEDEREAIVDWISVWLPTASVVHRQSLGSCRDRRLTTREYNHTMQDLFGVHCQFAQKLPPDPISAAGYQNDHQLLTMSGLQLEYYLEIARTAVQRYVSFGPPAHEPLEYLIEVEDVFYTTKDRYETMKLAPRPLAEETIAALRGKRQEAPARYSTPLPAMPPGELPATEELRASQPKLHQFYVPLNDVPPVGDYVVRVYAAATAGRGGSLPRMRVDAGVAYGDGDGLDAWRLGEVDVAAPLDAPGVYEFRGRLEDVPKPKPGDEIESLFDMVQIFIGNVARDEQAAYELGPGSLQNPHAPAVADNAKRLADAHRQHAAVRRRIDQLAAAGVNLLHIDAIEIEFIPNAGSERWQVDLAAVQSDVQQQRLAAAELLGRFLRRAYRRPVDDQEVAAKLALFDSLLAASGSFEESLRETLVSVLVSPHFLLLESPPVGAEDAPDPQHEVHRLATRLSYLLWSTVPDAQLMALADSGQLAESPVYLREAARLLDDRRSDRFIEEFGRQWLRLDKFPLVAVNPEYYPKYDDDLAEATVQETIASLIHVFRTGASALELLDSNVAMLNERLAAHYGLPPVIGGDLRPVRLPAESRRGGLLTQASLLTMNADGVDSHPIRRGVWLVDRLLGDPPPPPPPNVPLIDAADPDLRGLSLKQRIELHRVPNTCRDCHQKFDPWGISLENFDATGAWRETVAVRPGGQVAVDAATTLSDGTTIESVEQLKSHLVSRHGRQFARSLVEQMLKYALGRRLDFADQLEVDELYQQFDAAGYRLRPLVLAIVQSPCFQR